MEELEKQVLPRGDAPIFRNSSEPNGVFSPQRCRKWGGRADKARRIAKVLVNTTEPGLSLAERQTTAVSHHVFPFRENGSIAGGGVGIGGRTGGISSHLRNVGKPQCMADFMDESPLIVNLAPSKAIDSHSQIEVVVQHRVRAECGGDTATSRGLDVGNLDGPM